MATTKITSSSTAEYFAKNLQQVGFSSPTKAVLTTLKEAIDNALDACEEAGIAPSLQVEVKRLGKGGARNTDLVEVVVEDNGPGLDQQDLAKVFGEYLASSKFGRGRASRGQQGIGISAATTWAQLTHAAGVHVLSKTKKMRKALEAQVNVDIKGNKGLLKNKKMVEWKKPSGTKVAFRIDGRVQLNGDGGLLTYLEGTTLLNPHLELRYRLLENEEVYIPRVSQEVPKVPQATLPHPHTMKLGEFITHGGIYRNVTFKKFLKTAFSRVTDTSIDEFLKKGLPKELLNQPLIKIKAADYKKAFHAIQESSLSNPSTRSVLIVGEEALSKSVLRIGEVDFFSVVTRKPKICDHKPVVIEVALARFLNRGAEEGSIQLLRFANRVPLQFDKGSCAVTKAIESVNWRSYGLSQSKNSLPLGPYIFAVSVVSPFIKFKNASKETIDASDELVEEIRLALMQAGQKLSRHIKRENKAADLERKIKHIEQFGPVLVETLARITGATEKRRQKAILGLEKILGRDSKEAEKDLSEADGKLKELREMMKARGIGSFAKLNPQQDQQIQEISDDELSEKSALSDKKQKMEGANSGTRKKRTGQINKTKREENKVGAGKKVKPVNRKTKTKKISKTNPGVRKSGAKKAIEKKAGSRKASKKRNVKKVSGRKNPSTKGG